MPNLTSRLFRKLGFERVNVDPVEVVDLSAVVRVGAGGQTQVPLGSVMATDNFKRQVRLLGEVADAHRAAAPER